MTNSNSTLPYPLKTTSGVGRKVGAVELNILGAGDAAAVVTVEFVTLFTVDKDDVVASVVVSADSVASAVVALVVVSIGVSVDEVVTIVDDVDVVVWSVT